ncbi:hypothetical protein BH24ACT8_BH24ACT8_07860 [soil metagenome]
MERTFDTPAPVDLHVEISSGDVTVAAADTAQTIIEVVGRDADDTRVEQSGRTISVIGPRQGSGRIFGGAGGLRVTVSLPAGSDLSTRLGSADLVTRGALGRCRLKTGSGDAKLGEAATAEAVSGSGNVSIERLAGDLDARAGSGDISVRQRGGAARTVTGSGDVSIGTAEGPMTAKSGSGDVSVDRAAADLSVTTASGDASVRMMCRGTAQARTASGDVSVGVPSGTPVWTDISTISGDVGSRLESLGQPAQGQDYVELRLRTVSGDITVGHIGTTQPSANPADGIPENIR